MSDGDELVTVNDVRAAGLCGSGVRRWLEARGLRYRDLAAGLPAALLMGDGLAERAVACMRARLEYPNRSPGQGANAVRTDDPGAVRTPES